MTRADLCDVAESRVVPPGLDTVASARPAPSAVTSALQVALSRGSDTADVRRRLVDDVSDRLQESVGLRCGSHASTAPGRTRLSASIGPLGLADLVTAVGEEAVGYALLRNPYHSSLTLDVTALARCAVDNPFYSVRYAHARSRSMLRNAAELGVEVAFDDALGVVLAEAHDHSPETSGAALLREVAAFPLVVASAAERREPHRLARHLEATAEAFHRYGVTAPALPRGDEEPADTHRAAMLLVAATRVVLANGLDLLGLRAPDRW